MSKSHASLVRASALLSIGVALAGCATTGIQPPEPPQAPLTVVSKSAVTADPVLRLVTRGDTASAVGKSAVAGVLGAFSGRQVTTFKKEQLRGTAVDSRPNPASGPLRDVLQAGLREYAQAHPELAPPARFELHYDTWLLVYGELSNGSTPYELRFNVSLRGEPAELDNARFATVVQTCTPVPEAHPLEDWQRDDYALVEMAAQRYVAQCGAEFAAAVPRVFGAPRVTAVAEHIETP